MTAPRTSSPPSAAVEQAKRPRDISYWAHAANPVFKVAETPPGALNQLDGKEVTGPLRGFGPLWRKTYLISLPAPVVAPRDLVRTWKEHFPRFWPKGYTFYMPAGGINPGQVALVNMTGPGGVRLSTGMMVLFAGEEEFSFITPEGDVMAGWVTFGSYARGEATIAQVQLLVRSPDPIMDVLLRLGGYRFQDSFWKQMLVNLGRHFGVEARPTMQRVCIDPRVQWSNFKYLRYNPLIRTLGYLLLSPIRRLRGASAD